MNTLEIKVRKGALRRKECFSPINRNMKPLLTDKDKVSMSWVTQESPWVRNYCMSPKRSRMVQKLGSEVDRDHLPKLNIQSNTIR